MWQNYILGPKQKKCTSLKIKSKEKEFLWPKWIAYLKFTLRNKSNNINFVKKNLFKKNTPFLELNCKKKKKNWFWRIVGYMPKLNQNHLFKISVPAPKFSEFTIIIPSSFKSNTHDGITIFGEWWNSLLRPSWWIWLSIFFFLFYFYNFLIEYNSCI